MRAFISGSEYISGALPRQNRLSKLQYDRSPDPQNICVKNLDKWFGVVLEPQINPQQLAYFLAF